MLVGTVASEGLLILKFEFKNEARKDVVKPEESKRNLQS
jgi:hypothetical protein